MECLTWICLSSEFACFVAGEIIQVKEAMPGSVVPLAMFLRHTTSKGSYVWYQSCAKPKRGKKFTKKSFPKSTREKILHKKTLQNQNQRGRQFFFTKKSFPKSLRENFFTKKNFSPNKILILLLKPRFVIFSWEIGDLKVCNVSMSSWEKLIFRNDLLNIHLCIF